MTDYSGNETIFALASGSGKAGVAVIRVSGPSALAALEAMTAGDAPPPRIVKRAKLIDPVQGEALDDGLVLYFAAPRSFTGEDVVEFHVHGGRAVIAAVLGVLAAMPALRPAEAGEFSRRAFDNGKLDLTAIEGLADLVNAETEAQRRQAFRQMEGALEKLFEDWRARLIDAIARFEAEIDFSDEELPEGLAQEVARTVDGLAAEIADYLEDAHRGERIRDGIHIAILGPPNAGKSSLLNTLARRDAAIVSETAGTTRDVIEVHMNVGGFEVVLADTAGLRETMDAIEDEGVRRALDRAKQADMKIVVFDGAEWPARDPASEALIDATSFVVVNKSDLVDLSGDLCLRGRPSFAISVRTGEGIADFLAALEENIRSVYETSEAPPVTRLRHRLALEECREALLRFRAAQAVELAAEDLRLAARALGRITGRVDVEDILDVIFRDFCIGK